MKKLTIKCLFCGETIEYWENCNGFCQCFAKYYSNDKLWFNRKTGETLKEEVINDE